MDRDVFFQVHRDLPREGPGLPDDVHWALAQIPAPQNVLDAACGPGGDTVTLARALPDAAILAVDMVPHFVDAARARTAGFGARVKVQMADMLEVDGPFDLIWCAGAVYFAGITAALARWRRELAPGGCIAFSEPVLAQDASAAARRFWAGEGPVQDHDGVLQQIAQAGYRVMGTRDIIGPAWQAYYDPMETRIARLRRAGANQQVEAACRDAETEIANWRAAADEVSYLLVIAEPAA